MKNDHAEAVARALVAHSKEIESFVESFVAEIAGARVLYTAGNGGSSSIASHAVADFTKTAPLSVVGGPKRITCLTDNTPLLTAFSNDYSYPGALVSAFEHTHSAQDGKFALLAVSSSGKSDNVVWLAEVVKNWGGTVFAMVGFDGGTLKKKADYCVHVDSRDYGVVEDCHHVVMHSIVGRLKKINAGEQQ